MAVTARSNSPASTRTRRSTSPLVSAPGTAVDPTCSTSRPGSTSATRARCSSNAARASARSSPSSRIEIAAMGWPKVTRSASGQSDPVDQLGVLTRSRRLLALAGSVLVAVLAIALFHGGSERDPYVTLVARGCSSAYAELKTGRSTYWDAVAILSIEKGNALRKIHPPPGRRNLHRQLVVAEARLAQGALGHQPFLSFVPSRPLSTCVTAPS